MKLLTKEDILRIAKRDAEWEHPFPILPRPPASFIPSFYLKVMVATKGLKNPFGYKNNECWCK